MRLNELSAHEAAARIASGDMSSEDLVRACLARIAEREPSIKAFARVGAEAAIAAARDADTAVLLKDKDHPLRPLHGVPFAVKDIIETADMPTEYNSRLSRLTGPARMPRASRCCAARARSSSARPRRSSSPHTAASR